MTKRYKEFDILRGIATLGVVLIHITAPLITKEESVGIVINQLSRFAVPVFFFLSGWGLTISNSLERSRNYFDFYYSKIMKILPKYIVWNIIYIAYKNIISLMMNWDTVTPLQFLKGILLGTNYGHLYFVPLIILMYLIYPFLLKVGKTYLGIIFFLIITLFSQLMSIFTEIALLSQAQNIFNWVFYFVFGIWIASSFSKKINFAKLHSAKIKFLIILSLLFIIGLPLYSFGNEITSPLITTMRPMVILYTTFVILFFMVIDVDKIDFNIIDSITQYSFEIYLSHQLFISLFSNIYRILNIEVPSIIYILGMLLLVLTCSLFLTKVIETIKYRLKK